MFIKEQLAMYSNNDISELRIIVAVGHYQITCIKYSTLFSYNLIYMQILVNGWALITSFTIHGKYWQGQAIQVKAIGEEKFGE